MSDLSAPGVVVWGLADKAGILQGEVFAYEADARAEMGDWPDCRLVMLAEARFAAEARDESAISARLTAAVRAADLSFEKVGGSSRHYVNDCLLCALEASRLTVVDVLVPIHLASAERDIATLAAKLDAADRLNAELLAVCRRVAERDFDSINTDIIDAARAALSKARGA